MMMWVGPEFQFWVCHGVKSAAVCNRNSGSLNRYPATATAEVYTTTGPLPNAASYRQAKNVTVNLGYGLKLIRRSSRAKNVLKPVLMLPNAHAPPS